MGGRLQIRQASRVDSKRIVQLVGHTPQDEGRLKISFERLPDFFHGTRVATSKPDVWVTEDTSKNRIACVYSMGHRLVYFNGQLRDIRYCNDLRIHEDYRGGTALARLYRAAKKQLGTMEFLQTTILRDNAKSMDTITSQRAGLPGYYEYGDYKTKMIYLGFPKISKGSPYTVRRATFSDLSKIQNFFDKEAPAKQFYPHYNFSKIGTRDPYYRDIKLDDYFLAFQGEELVGITGVWDQKKFKQTRLTDYSRSMRLFRVPINLLMKMSGGMPLPKEGGIIEYLMMHAVLTKGNDPKIFAALLASIYGAFRKTRYKALVGGFAINDPLLKVLDRYRGQEIHSKHFLVCYDGDPRPEIDQDRLVYLEPSRL